MEEVSDSTPEEVHVQGHCDSISQSVCETEEFPIQQNDEVSISAHTRQPKWKEKPNPHPSLAGRGLGDSLLQTKVLLFLIWLPHCRHLSLRKMSDHCELFFSVHLNTRMRFRCTPKKDVSKYLQHSPSRSSNLTPCDSQLFCHCDPKT